MNLVISRLALALLVSCIVWSSADKPANGNDIFPYFDGVFNYFKKAFKPTEFAAFGRGVAYVISSTSHGTRRHHAPGISR
jgi:hypothetical protein